MTTRHTADRVDLQDLLVLDQQIESVVESVHIVRSG